MAEKPSKYLVTCPPRCGLNPQRVGPAVTAALVAMRENGAGVVVMSRRAGEMLGMERSYPTSSMQSHLKHFREVETIAREQQMPATKLGDLEILDLVIQRGAANSVNWKPTIKDTIEAMKLKIQMTGNSAFDDLIALFDGVDASTALGEDISEVEEAPEAVLSPEEREDVLEEPFLDD